MSSAAAAIEAQIVPKSLPKIAYKNALGLSVVLLIATVALYFPALHHPFANIDDQGYVYENQHVTSGLKWTTIRWATTTFDDNNWHPLTWLSHALDCQMFGLNPAGHHFVNDLWHALDALTLLWVLFLATGSLGRSFMVAALFALHPINVESVAWMAERKTLLSTFFFLLALGAYQRYARARDGGERASANRCYLVVAGLFILGLMAKPQIITFPCVLLLWDYWPLRRISFDGDTRRKLLPLVKEKIPLLVICLASALVTMKAQRVGHPQQWPYSLAVRLGNCVLAYGRYVGKALWPSHLAIMYLHPGNAIRWWQVGLSGLFLATCTALVVVYRRYRYLPVGWFWFLGTMAPTIGFIQVGRQAMADRYAYQSFLGLYIIACWGIADWASERHVPGAALLSACAAVLLTLEVLTHHQLGFWKDNFTLWSHADQVTENNWMAHDLLAGILSMQGRSDEAYKHFLAAATINPDDAGAHIGVGVYLQQHGKFEDAIVSYRRALATLDDPAEKAKVYQNMGVAYRDMGYMPQAMDCFRKSQKAGGH